MPVQAQRFVPQQPVGRCKLVQNVVPVVLAVFCQAGGVEGHPHVQAVQPDLIRIDVLMPEIPGRGTGVIVQDMVRPRHGVRPARFPGEIPQDAHGLAEADFVDVVFACSPVGHGAVLIHQKPGLPAHRLQPAVVPGRKVQVPGTHHAQVVFVVPGFLVQETGKHPVQILFKILQPHEFCLLFTARQNPPHGSGSPHSARLTSRSGSKRPSGSSCMNPKYRARATLVP